MSLFSHQATEQTYDPLIQAIADYVLHPPTFSEEALQTARYALLDSLGCALLALNYPECTKLLGPVVPGTVVPKGAFVLGTPHYLDPLQAAFQNGVLIRWLDYNDTWLAKEWGHPSDNLAAILSLAQYFDHVSLDQVLKTMIMAYEIQGVLALGNAFNRVGLDHVILVKLASCAVSCVMLKLSREKTLAALSQVFVDGQSLRTYRHAPNTGSRKSWAAGDASARGLFLAMLAEKGEMGYPTALSANMWGFSDVLFRSHDVVLDRPLKDYVMSNILFKISFPAEFHAQTAVEAAVILHPTIKDRIHEIERIDIRTHESAIRIISKEGMLNNPADRDHCLQYMVAIGLLFGNLTADHYEDAFSKDSRIDDLRKKMVVSEDPCYTEDYLNPDSRSIANRIQITFSSGDATDAVEVYYPIGHARRRSDGMPLLIEKFRHNAKTRLSDKSVSSIESFVLFGDTDQKMIRDLFEFLR